MSGLSSLLLGSRGTEDVGKAAIPLVTRILEDVSLRLQVEYRGVGTLERARIVDSYFVAHLVSGGPSVSLDQVQRRAVAAEARGRVVRRDGRVEIRDVDDQRVAVPATPGVAHVLANGGRQMRPAVHGNDARVVDHLVRDHDVAWRLHDAHRQPAIRWIDNQRASCRTRGQIFVPVRGTGAYFATGFDRGNRLRAP